MDENVANLFEKALPIVAAIIMMGVIGIIEAQNGETSIVTALVWLIGLLAGIKIPSEIFNKSSK
jgi:disulfide bond formation protein DsbB